MKKQMTTLALAAITSMLAACGGGDVQEELTIKAGNEQTVAAADDVQAEAAFHSVGEMQEPTSMGSLETQVRNGLNTKLGGINGDKAQALATSKPVRALVHSPANIRSLYGMPAVPSDFTKLTAAERAALGAGQTIYIVGAFAGANIAADLNRFSTKFGLGGCTEVAIPVKTVALAAHDVNAGCQIAVVNTYRGAVLTDKAPKYNSTWAAEYALDVQWAHASAPLARIVVLQGENSFTNSLADGIQVANKMGPGVVSMSWVASEAQYVERYETFFKTKGMTYLAAAGDFGAQANWPATSPNVISVGGTTVWADAGVRKEVTWSRSGGGFSVWFPRPDYQAQLMLPNAGTVTGKNAVARGKLARVGADVSFNADPYTGQFVVITAPGGTTKWFSYGGTSIGTPQWAGIVAVANAVRKANGKDVLGNFMPQLYAADAAVFNDVTEGSNGSQAWAQSGIGYDVPTGRGTPNMGKFVNTAAGM